MATQRPSSSTSKIKRDHSSPPGWKYEVFLSFYGKDTRRGFTDHLRADLKRKGILVFRDDETLKQGEYISQALLKAIQESEYAIVILSANYASSKWCLMELAEIVEWETKTKLITIIPIFYCVDPSDIRNQRGTFAEAFAAHEKDPKVDIKELDMWRKAFRKVGNIVGEHIHDKYESTIIQKVCGRISNELNCRFSRHDYEKLVAIDSHVDEMMKLLDIESNDVRFVGIYGMGGVGKTLLAEIIYDRVSCQFEGSSFIYCIREESRARGLASLQKQLLSMIIKEKMHVWDHRNGSEVISRRLRDKKVFIVLDDVDSDEQLTALAEDRKWFGPGSRVIITCRDSHLLRTHGVYDIFKVELLQTAEALQLFRLSAFDKTQPAPENYEDLSVDFVNYAQGLPLALKVLGSFLRDRTIDAWKSERDQLEKNPHTKIMNVLQISFDKLEYWQKELFLDMACLFRGQHWVHNTSYEMLKSLGYHCIDIDVLVEKSLISKSKYGWLSMHDLLKEMGQEIVRRECREEPGRRSRLCGLEDVSHVLNNDTGSDAIKGIVMDFCSETKEIRLNAKVLSKMRKLRFFKFHESQTIKWRGKPLKYMPTNELRFLEWSGYASRSWPSSFQPNNLTILRMYNSRMKRLWKGSMVFYNLKVLDVSGSEDLIKTPDLTGAPNLEKLDFSGCRSLCELHPSIEAIKRLQELRMSGSRIKQLWKGLVVFENLKVLDVSDSKNLIKTPDLTGAPLLENLNLSGCRSLCEVHPSIGSLKRLKELWLNKCSGLKKLPDLSRLKCLTDLWALEIALTQIPSPDQIPKSIREFHLEVRNLVRDPSYDIGSFVEYEMEGIYDLVKSLSIDFDGGDRTRGISGTYYSDIVGETVSQCVFECFSHFSSCLDN